MWFGHVVRMDDKILPARAVYGGNMESRKRDKYMDRKRELKEQGHGYEIGPGSIRDKKKWSHLA